MLHIIMRLYITAKRGPCRNDVHIECGGRDNGLAQRGAFCQNVSKAEKERRLRREGAKGDTDYDRQQ